MEQLTNKQRSLISSAYANFTDGRILVFSSIQGEAFETFKRILVMRNAPIELEELVLFRDLTWFGGGEEGILITATHFYYYQWGYQQIAISGISEMKIGGWFNENIEFVLTSGQMISIWLAKLFHEVSTIIEIMQADDEVEVDAQSAPVQVQCLGCRAIVRPNQKFCEYCRSPLST